MGAEPTGLRSCCSLPFLAVQSITEPTTPLARDTHPLRHTPTLTPTTIMLAPTDMQESSLSHNEFVLCLRLFLRPSSALSPCEFTTCMRAVIPSPVPACLCSLPQPSLALSPSAFESYMRSLTPTPVLAGFRQSGSRPGHICCT